MSRCFLNSFSLSHIVMSTNKQY
uniref:Uncharacterized protein n=1 Tax=Anguilla anguilla TaxID=7936 RepID=A0A0E9SJK7_ANGAN